MAEQVLDFSDAYNDVMLEFLEVAFHQILFTRQVYPSGFFEKRRKYGIIVQMCNKKILNDYIKNVLDGMGVLLRKDAVRKVELVVLDDRKHPVESFVFAVNKQDNRDIQERGGQMEELDQQLKGVLLRIAVSETLLEGPVLGEDATFEVKVHALQSSVSELEGTTQFHVFPWMSADSVGKSPPSPQTQVVPLKSFVNNLVKMQVYVQQFPQTVAQIMEQ